jgi:phytoene dehydrogenase-like protein
VTVAIIGAGVAGLTCAKILNEYGKNVVVLEAAESVGGRVRTDYFEGYRLDRGFQVLFTSYPAVKREINLNQLDLRRLDPGAIICLDGRREVLTDPIRDPTGGIPAALSRVVALPDKLRTLALTLSLRRKTVRQVLEGPDQTSEAFLRTFGFSDRYINNFMRPFFGGIFLDRSLQTSSKALKFDFKMLIDGDIAIPSLGMQAIPEQLAYFLFKKGSIRLNTPVREIIRENGRVLGVQLDGERLEADAVVVATSAPEVSRLTGLQNMPAGKKSTITLYYTGTTRLYKGKKLLLNAYPDALVNNAILLTNIVTEYAPEGKHLLSATLLGEFEQDDETLFKMATQDLRRMFAGDTNTLLALNTYTPLRAYRIPYAQFEQPPGIHPDLPDNATNLERLYLAGEFTEASSINAAMISGEKAARLILKDC